MRLQELCHKSLPNKSILPITFLYSLDPRAVAPKKPVELTFVNFKPWHHILSAKFTDFIQLGRWFRSPWKRIPSVTINFLREPSCCLLIVVQVRHGHGSSNLKTFDFTQPNTVYEWSMVSASENNKRPPAPK